MDDPGFDFNVGLDDLEPVKAKIGSLKSDQNRRLVFRDLPETVQEAVEFIREHEPEDGYLVGFSGGKDSIVTKKLVELAGVRHEAVYSCTGIDPPEVLKFIRHNYPGVRFVFPKFTFWHGIMKKNPPSVFARWCCDVLKKNPTKKIQIKSRIMGIRKEESKKRSQYPRINKIRKTKQIQYYPILEWNEAEIWEFIEGMGLAYPSLYDEGFGRLGCVVCPQRGFKQHTHCRVRWPGLYHTFDVVVTKWWLMRKEQGYDMRHEGPQEYLEAWYHSDFKAFKEFPRRAPWATRALPGITGDADHGYF